MTLTPRAVFTDSSHGDLRVGGDPHELATRRAAIHPAPWTWLSQSHGNGVVVVSEAGQHAGVEADAIVTTVADAPIAVHTADCAPLLLHAAADAAIAVVHAGWRGLTDGVIEAAAKTMSDLGHPPTKAVLGPCIRGRCYEFGDGDLAEVAARYGPGVVSSTAWGTPALDLAAAVRSACGWLDVELQDQGICTACSPNHWSHRARQDTGRQALVAWLSPS